MLARAATKTLTRFMSTTLPTFRQVEAFTHFIHMLAIQACKLCSSISLAALMISFGA